MYKKYKETAKNLTRLIFFTLLSLTSTYKTIENPIVWACLGFIIIYVLPECVAGILSIENKYDGSFVIDETDPTDVKIKLIMDTEADDIVNCNDILIKVDIRDKNIEYNGGGVSNEKGTEKET